MKNYRNGPCAISMPCWMTMGMLFVSFEMLNLQPYDVVREFIRKLSTRDVKTIELSS